MAAMRKLIIWIGCFLSSAIKMGVMGGNCCGLARYQTVITLGELHLNTDDKLNLKFNGLFAFFIHFFFFRNWFDRGRCSTFHDKHRQHMDPVSDEQIKILEYTLILNRIKTWISSNARELRAPMVQSMRAIGPRDPDLVVNALVDYPVIWNWLLTAVSLNFDVSSS